MPYSAGNFKPIRFTPHPQIEGAVTCSNCRSIWTPGTLVWALKVRQEPDDTTGIKYHQTSTLVPIDQCPGCGYREGD